MVVFGLIPVYSVKDEDQQVDGEKIEQQAHHSRPVSFIIRR